MKIFFYFFHIIFHIYNKKRLQRKPHERYESLSREKKRKRQYGCERYKNLPEDEKEKLVEYRKK